MQSPPDDERIVFGTACFYHVPRLPVFLPIGICGSKSNQPFVHGIPVSLTRNCSLLRYAWCPASVFKVHVDRTSNKCCERVYPFFQDQSYGGHQSDNVGGCQCRHRQAVPNTMRSSSGGDCIVHFRRKYLKDC